MACVIHDYRLMTLIDKPDGNWNLQKFEKDFFVKPLNDQNTSNINEDITGTFLSRGQQSVPHDIEDALVQMIPAELAFVTENLDPIFANSIRRAISMEVPAVAIEKVHISRNSTVMNDETLAHRLGLLPICFDPSLLEYPSQDTLSWLCDDTHFDSPLHQIDTWVATCGLNPKEALLFELKIEPSRQCGHDRYDVIGEVLRWIPLPGQQECFKNPPRMAHYHVPLVRVNRDQDIYGLCVAVKGVGRDHYKFSPVSPVTYGFRLELEFLQPVKDDLAHKLQSQLPPGLIEIDESGVAFVTNISNYDHCLTAKHRRILDDPQLKAAIKLTSNLQVQIFKLESVGQYDSVKQIVLEGFQVLLRKCQHYLRILKVPSTVTRVDKLDSDMSGYEIPTEIVNSLACGMRLVLHRPVAPAEETVRTHCTVLFHGEDHTFCAPIAFLLTNRSDVKLATISKPHPLEKRTNLFIHVYSGSDPVNVFQAAIETFVKAVGIIEDQFKQNIL